MSINDIFRAARADHQAGRLAQAETLYRQVLSMMPSHPGALNLLGVLMHQTQRPEEACQLLAKAIAADPAAADYYSNLNVVLTAMGRHAEAMDAILQAVSRDPRNPEYLNNQGVTQMRLGQWAAAKNSFQAALQLRPEFPAAVKNLAELEQLSHGGTLPEPSQYDGVITNPHRVDGFGAQFQTLIYSVIYAELNRKKFVYTPFKEMAHNYGNDPAYLASKENLINFLPHFELNQNVEQSIIREDFIRFFEANLDRCAASESLKKIKRIFRENKTVPPPDVTRIAVHVRRPNVHDNRTTGTDTPDAVYVNVIQRILTERMNAKPVEIHVYSQGNPENFAVYQSLGNVHLHVDESVEDTFTAMVQADVLVTSRSSLSYVAALLSDGEIHYLRFWHPPLRHWKVVA